MTEHRTGGPGAENEPGELVDRLPPDVAERAAARIERETGAEVSLGDPASTVKALDNEVRDEADGMVPGIGLGVATASQARGAATWTAVGAVGGAVLGALIGLIPMADLSLGTRELIWIIVGVLTGSTIGFVFGGGRQPEIEGDVRDTAHELTITVRADTTADADRAEKVLAEADLETADRARKMAKEGEHESMGRL